MIPPESSPIADYLLDSYGTCDRGPDCYWGKDPAGNFNGCLKTGWRGTACPHWQPLETSSYQELAQKMSDAAR